MKRIAILLLAAVALGGLVFAHGEKDGILVDAKCGPNIAATSSEAEAHQVSCSLDSKASGYGIIADGKFFKFDDYGNKQAYLLLKVSQKKANLKVRVTGHIEGDMIKVGALETVD